MKAVAMIGKLVLRVNALKTRAYHAWIVRCNAPRPGEILFVPPESIRGHMVVSQAARLKKRTGFPSHAVVGGDWDREIELLDFRKTDVFQSCHMHWIQGIAWQETPLVRLYEKQIENGRPGRFDSREALLERYDRLDSIFQTVGRERAMATRTKDLVIINIARDGRLIWGPNGRHRIAIALIVGLRRMPVRIGFVHPKGLGHLDSLRKSAPDRPEPESVMMQGSA